jgi:S1-C subfamily serine protease
MSAHAAPAQDASRAAIHMRSAQIVLIEDAQGIGTGLLVGADGFVLTNKHVAPSLGPYRVLLADGKDVRGVGVHQSPHHDLAIVKIAASPMSFLDVAADVADEYVVGEEVFALGHPRGCRFSVARGIISNPHREMEKEYYVQTDVSINPGNSGGPLVDAAGKLVGIVTMMLSNSQGLGFAVPGHIAADYVRHVRRLLRANVVKIPDELLTQPEAHRESAPEIVRRAVGALMVAGRGSIEEEKGAEGYYKLKHKGALTEVTVRDGLFSVRVQVAPLGPSERQNAAFLCKMLELSGSQDVGGVAFVIRDSALHVGLSRRAAGLDLEEATWAIDLVSQMGVDAPQKIAGLLFGAGLQQVGATSSPALPPMSPAPSVTPMPGQPMMPGHMPGQPMMPMPGQPMMPGQNMMPGQMPGQNMMPAPMPGQPMMPGQMPGQPMMPGQNMMPGQMPAPMPGQPMMPGQNMMPGQMPGQPMMPGQNMMPGQVPGQPMPGQPMMPGQNMAPGAPQYGAPQYGAPQYGAPQYGTPQPGAPQYGAPQPGAPQYGTPQPGAPQYGTPQPGAPQYGAPQPGAPQYGAPQPGAAPPAPGAPDAQPDPGYPILQLPSGTGWK